MTSSMLFSQINALSPSMIKEVEHFVEFLKEKESSKNHSKKRKFGCEKGFFEMKDDFDAPLDDFKEYM